MKIAIAIALVALLLGGVAIYSRQGSVAGTETNSDSDFSQLDNTISGL